MKNISYLKKIEMSSWRKVSIASWRPKGDSSTYVMEDINLENVLLFCQKQNINFYTFCIKAIGSAIKENPKINATIRRNKIYQRKDVSIFFHAIKNKIDQDDDLSGFVLKNPQLKEFKQLDSDFKQQISLIKNGITPHDSSKKITAKTPSIFVKPLMDLYSKIAYEWNWNLNIFKMPKDAFGSVMVTTIGSLDLTAGLCPIAPYTKVPMVISIGKIEERPVVCNHEIIIQKMATFGFTFDHRLIDGIHFSNLFKCLNSFFKNPNSLL